MWTALTLLHLSAHLAAAQLYHDRALYPAAYRIKRGTHSLVDPAFQRSVEDVNLLYEILLAGSHIQSDDGGGLLIPDGELASLRPVEKLEVICDDVLPKTLSEIRRLAFRLEQQQQRRPLNPRDFERTVLTLVFVTQTLEKITDRNQREAWSDAFVRLFGALRRDLSKSS